jgi:hypothetical protein
MHKAKPRAQRKVSYLFGPKYEAWLESYLQDKRKRGCDLIDEAIAEKAEREGRRVPPPRLT